MLGQGAVQTMGTSARIEDEEHRPGFGSTACVPEITGVTERSDAFAGSCVGTKRYRASDAPPSPRPRDIGHVLEQ